MTSVSVKRIYEPASGDDGLRILVDRLWPRGVAKDKARIDLRLKEVAPSNALRKRMHGLPLAWEEFVAEYGRELEQEPARTALRDLRERIAQNRRRFSMPLATNPITTPSPFSAG